MTWPWRGQTRRGGVLELSDPRGLRAEAADPGASRYLAPEPFLESDDPEIRDRPFHLAVTALAVAWTMVGLAVHSCLRLRFFPAALKFASTGCDAGERTGLFTSGIVSTRPGQKIALYFTGRQHAGENLRDVLAHRAEALAAIREDKIDLVISDLGLADQVRAETFLEAVRTLHPNLPIIIATGYDGTQLEERLRKHPRTAILGKPYDIAQLQAAITAAEEAGVAE